MTPTDATALATRLAEKASLYLERNTCEGETSWDDDDIAKEFTVLLQAQAVEDQRTIDGQYQQILICNEKRLKEFQLGESQLLAIHALVDRMKRALEKSSHVLRITPTREPILGFLMELQREFIIPALKESEEALAEADKL